MYHVNVTQVLAAQVQSKLWVRNGLSMAHKVSLLKENAKTAETLDLDIALMQCCAVLCRELALSNVPHLNDFFVTTILQRYGLLSFFDWNPTVPEEEEEEVERLSHSSIVQRLQRFFFLKRVRGDSEAGQAETPHHDSESDWLQAIPREQKLILAEQCLHLLINLVNERSAIGRYPSSPVAFPADQPLLRREEVCVHRFVDAMPHGEKQTLTQASE